MPPPNSSLTVRQARKQDIPSVTEFLNEALLVHRHLDWRPLMDWIDREPFLLRYNGNQLTALLSCAPDPAGIAWIHAFAVESWSAQIEAIWQSLLTPASQMILSTSCEIYTVSLSDWYTRLLKSSGFHRYQNIIVLYWGKTIPPRQPAPPEVLIRPMEISDLEEVAAVDRLSFEPAWVISRESLERAFLQSSHANVAEIDGRIIGYELSTSTHLSAHLARLAVLPGFTRAHIGYNLVFEMLLFFTSQGIWQITVNTQDTNTGSLALYKTIGFFQTGDEFPVYFFR